ncbi:MAG: hypothetical protein R3C56_13015 [Pirellulaceae bacterium]
MTQTQFDEALKLFKGATRDGRVGGAYEDPFGDHGSTKVTEATMNWLNRTDAPRWVELVDTDPVSSQTYPYSFNGGDFDILPGGNRDGSVAQSERYATDWAIAVIKDASAIASGTQVITALSDVYSDVRVVGEDNHTEHKAGLDIDIRINDLTLKQQIELVANQDNLNRRTISAFENESLRGLNGVAWDGTKGWFINQLTSEEKKIVETIRIFIEASGDRFEYVHVGNKTADLRGYQWIKRALAETYGFKLGTQILGSPPHFNHFHISLQPLVKPTTVSQLRSTINNGFRDINSSTAIASRLSQSLGADLPIIDETLSEITDIANVFTRPFQAGVALSSTATVAAPIGVGQTALALSPAPEDLRSELQALGFEDVYVSETVDENGDYVRATYNWTFDPKITPLSFDLQTGFAYFDDAVQGHLEGVINASVEPITISIAFGIDAGDGVPTFYLSELSTITIGGVSIQGTVDANLGIRNLLDVDVDGALTGQLSGVVTFQDDDEDSKIRLEQFTNPALITTTVGGSVAFNPILTAKLPIIGAIVWNGSWGATFANGVISINPFTLSPPSVASVTQLIKAGYEAIAGSFDLFGGKSLIGELPVVNLSLAKILGLPEELLSGSYLT